MSQNPYAQFGTPAGGGPGGVGQGGPGGPRGTGGFGEFLEPLESRTSVLAVLSLIAGLLCFIPASGVLALVLGGAAVILIGQSRGRLRGMGLAITGIVLGLLFSIIWVMIVMGVVSMGQFIAQQWVQPVGSVITGIETGDRSKARAMFTADADSAITDEQIADFGNALRSEWGAMRGTPQSLWEMIADYSEVGPRMQSMPQGRNDIVPTPVRFDKGITIIVLQIEQGPVDMGNRPPGAPAFELPVKNIGYFARDGSIVWMNPKDQPQPRRRRDQRPPAPTQPEDAPDPPDVPDASEPP